MPQLNLKITYNKFADELYKVNSLMDASEAAGFLRGIIDAKETVMPSEYLIYFLGDNQELAQELTEKKVERFFSVIFSVQNKFSKAGYHNKRQIK